MPWQPEDWSEWPIERWAGAGCEPSHVRAVREILQVLADCGHKRVVLLTRPHASALPISSRDEAITVELGESCSDASGLPSSACDVIVALDSIGGIGIDDVLPRLRAALVEGGVLLATFPSRAPSTRAFAIRGGDPVDEFHEIELQYRLRCAGFQGLRLLRFRSDGATADTLLCMAVRRALN